LIKKIKNCRLCFSKNLVKVIDLKKSPLANNLKDKIKLSINQKKYPLSALFCKNCFHLQLSHIVKAKILFNKYFYLTGTSSATHLHFEQYYRAIKKRLKKNQKKILEIASNDGTFLKKFDKTFEKFGVDPAKNLKSFYNNQDIKFFNNFFSNKISKKIKKKYGSFDVITANNVCAHIDEFHDFINGIKNILSLEGFFVFEVSYLKEVLKKKTFDTIYHEHLDYHSLTPLKSFFENLQLKIFDVEFSKVQGGSIRVYVCHKTSYRNEDVKIKININKEKILGMHKISTYFNFQKKIISIKKSVNLLLKNIKRKNLTIYGFGAAAKATTFLNFFDIDQKIINKVVDDNSLKQGNFIPGTSIKIHDPRILYEDKPNFILILSWNFANHIIRNYKKYAKNGKFILSYPYPRILKS
jgi:hypothetical protein